MPFKKCAWENMFSPIRKWHGVTKLVQAHGYFSGQSAHVVRWYSLRFPSKIQKFVMNHTDNFKAARKPLKITEFDSCLFSPSPIGRDFPINFGRSVWFYKSQVYTNKWKLSYAASKSLYRQAKFSKCGNCRNSSKQKLVSN